MLVLIGFITVIESLSRTLLARPSAWSLDLCCYILIWAVFFASPWAFQEKGHVAVDLLRDLVEKLFGPVPRRIMAIAGYICVGFLLITLLLSAFRLTSEAIRLDKLTIANLQIQTVYLDIAIVTGTVIMIMTVVFIILDLFAKGDKYL